MSFEEFEKRYPNLKEEFTPDELRLVYRDLATLARIAAELALERGRSKSDQEDLESEESGEVS